MALPLPSPQKPVPLLLCQRDDGEPPHLDQRRLGKQRLRFKLGVACVVGARHALEQMIRYAKQRIAFGKPIAEFGLIQRKISASAARLYATESMVYRTAGLMDAKPPDAGLGQPTPEQARKRIEEYAVECSIVKVYGSEMLTLVADELIATMGGYGYVEEYPAERYYRDARINRIFEGTNEINRLIITSWLMKRALSGQLPLLGAIKSVMDEAMQPPGLDAGAARAKPEQVCPGEFRAGSPLPVGRVDLTPAISGYSYSGFAVVGFPPAAAKFGGKGVVFGSKPAQDGLEFAGLVYRSVNGRKS